MKEGIELRCISGVVQFPMYALASLGCYGLGALGYGMMMFRVCPEEADLLQKVELFTLCDMLHMH